MNDNSVLSWYKNGWDQYRANFKKVLPIILGLLIYNWSLSVVDHFFENLKFQNISFLLIPVVHAGYMYFVLKCIRNETAGRRDFLKSFQRYFLVTAQYLLLIFLCAGVFILALPGAFRLSFVLFFTPLFFIGLKLSFAPILALDKQLSFTGSLRTSWHITKKQIFKLVLVLLPFMLYFVLFTKVNAQYGYKGPFAFRSIATLAADAFFIAPVGLFIWLTAYNSITKAVPDLEGIGKIGKISKEGLLVK